MGCGYNMYNTDTHLHNLYNFGYQRYIDTLYKHFSTLKP